MGAHRGNKPGIIIIILMGAAIIAAAYTLATLILVAVVDGDPWGLLALACGGLIGILAPKLIRDCISFINGK